MRAATRPCHAPPPGSTHGDRNVQASTRSAPSAAVRSSSQPDCVAAPSSSVCTLPLLEQPPALTCCFTSRACAPGAWQAQEQEAEAASPGARTGRRMSCGRWAAAWKSTPPNTPSMCFQLPLLPAAPTGGCHELMGKAPEMEDSEVACCADRRCRGTMPNCSAACCTLSWITFWHATTLTPKALKCCIRPTRMSTSAAAGLHPCPTSASHTVWAPETLGPSACACWVPDGSVRAPGARDTPNRATHDGWVKGRHAERACFRPEASNIRPSMTSHALGCSPGTVSSLMLPVTAPGCVLGLAWGCAVRKACTRRRHARSVESAERPHTCLLLRTERTRAM
mmetsp:Transcript_8366/g.20756  ORF Transcript_8366/g.20756 Transcript_8366/m.20756 type:complete len:338 (-) Transcript_8366:1325-2338(-)